MDLRTRPFVGWCFELPLLRSAKQKVGWWFLVFGWVPHMPGGRRRPPPPPPPRGPRGGPGPPDRPSPLAGCRACAAFAYYVLSMACSSNDVYDVVCHSGFGVDRPRWQRATHVTRQRQAGAKALGPRDSSRTGVYCIYGHDVTGNTTQDTRQCTDTW
jgi:hypothetical protein